MGLLDTLRSRADTKVEGARRAAEERARSEGAGADEARAAGDRAAAHKRRRVRFTGYGGAGGTSS